MATGQNEKGYKYCIVPYCPSTTFRTPNKRFLIVPKGKVIRKRWYQACRGKMGSVYTNHYCCEDHFDIENDCTNVVQHNLTGRRLKVKDNVVPHIFECQKNLKLTPSRQGRSNVPKKQRKEMVKECSCSSGEPSLEMENDVVNMVQHKLTGCPLRLKDGVLPRIFDCQKAKKCIHSMKPDHSCENSGDKKTHCQMDSKKKSSLRKERAWVRERKKIVADLLRAASTESKESNPVSELEISSVSAVPLLPEVPQSIEVKVKNEVCDTDVDMTVEDPKKLVIKEEPESDSEGSESEESELNYVLDMVMQENKEHEENSCSYSSDTNQDSAVPELSLECLNEENEESILPDGPAVSGCEEINSDESSTTSKKTRKFRYQQPSRVSNWEGDYEFKMKVSCESSGKNSLSVYSDLLQKLYISKDVGFRVLVYAKNVPPGSKLRASAIFSNPIRDKEIVTRCPAHAEEDRLKGMKHYFHVVQSVSSQSVYEMDLASGQFSVVVPYEEPQEGERYTAYGYKLTCFNSCSSGINRRPFVILYTLENNGVVLGRYTVDVKVCACPTRDLRLELLRLQNNSPESKSEEENCDEPKTYSITVDNVNLFKFLTQMKVLYESSDFVKCVTNMDK